MNRFRDNYYAYRVFTIFRSNRIYCYRTIKDMFNNLYFFYITNMVYYLTHNVIDWNWYQ